MTTLRYDILAAMKARLETITVGNGYSRTVAEVAIEDRGITEIVSGGLPFIGIVPAGETWRDQSGGQVEVTWTIALVAYLSPATASTTAVVDALSDFTKDIRKALYSSGNGGNLNVAGVRSVKVTGRQGLEGHRETADKLLAGMIVNLAVDFEEDADG